MKKIISTFVVCAMLLSLSTALAYTSNAKADYIDYVDALYFTSEPNLDGIITEAEWGSPTVTVDGWDATTLYDKDPYMNRFFYWADPASSQLELYYTLWLRWDENYFYIGAKVKDPDGHSLKNGKNFTWNGDAIQCRIDNGGPNAASYGDTFDYTWSDNGKPWSSGSIGDFAFGYVQIAGNFSEAYENVSGKGMTEYSNPSKGACQLAIVPCGAKYNGSDYSADSADGITTYEIALPWAYIDDKKGYERSEYNIIKNPTGAVGREYGMSLVTLNAKEGSKKFNSYLTWGSGICGAQQTEAPLTCGGSNSVTISAESVTPQRTSGITGGIPTQSLVPQADDRKIDYYGKTITFDSAYDASLFGGNTGDRIQLDDGNWAINYGGSAEDGNLNYQNYFALGSSHSNPTSFTFETDVCITGTELFEQNYESEIFNWFGGSDALSFKCGYFFKDGMFKIIDYSDEDVVIANKKMNFTLDTWHHWKFQYDNSSCVARFWFDGELIFNTSWRYFYYTSTSAITSFRRMNVQCMFDNVSLYNVYGDVEVIYKPGDVNADGNINSVDLLQFKMYMVKKVTLPAAGLVVADVNGDGKVNAFDLLMLKLKLSGKVS